MSVDFIFGEGNGSPLQYSCLENPLDGGARWATIHGVAESWTRLSDFTFTFHCHALERETATHSSVLVWRILRTAEDGRAWWAAVYGVAESDTTEATQKQQHTSYSIDRMSFGQKYGELKNWNGLIGSTFSNKIFPICHPVTLPTSFWFFMTPLPFQKIIPKSSLVYLILTCVYFFFLPYSWFCTVLWNLVVHFVISTLF